MDRELAVAIRAARAAGAILRGGMRMEKHVSTKAHDRDPVTIFDKQSEETIVTILKAEFPAYGFLSEEGLDWKGDSPCRWVLDPLDGTNNFLRGVPQFAVSIGLECSGRTEVACIYDPLRDQLFTARRGGGAYMNGEQIRVSDTTELKDALIALEFSSYPPRAVTLYERMRRLIGPVRGVRAFGSACLNLAYVAAGMVDGAWFLSLSQWDVSAGILLIEEAGGKVTDLSGRPLLDPQTGLLATNGLLHPELLDLVEG